MLLASLYLGRFSYERREAQALRRAYAVIEAADPYTSGGSSAAWPWYSNWLHRLLGDEEPYEMHFLVFGNFSQVDDNTLVTVSEFDELGQLWLGEQSEVTDAGLEHLEKLSELRDLDLGDSPVTPEAVAKLRQALPKCEIRYGNRDDPTGDRR